MGDIRSLLNPLEMESVPAEESNIRAQTATPESETPTVKATSDTLPIHLPSPCSSTSIRELPSPLHTRKKQKTSKDAAVFTRGTIRGECRYPPDEFRDDLIAAHHQQYDIYPMGDIAEYPRHIPYNSEKKMFLDKTGRECFEVFHYNFRIPGDEKVHCMMWDYNIGLVRTTPLFKCTGHSKTTPAKMLNRNVGLREICHSITGGALVAQGYWMPYEAAKAIAATFCWGIRYALTPVFGHDFPSTCIPPGSDKYGDMLIDAAITRKCAEKANAYRALEQHASRGASTMPSPVTPDTPTFPRLIKPLRSKALNVRPPTSGYSTDVSNDDAYSLSSATPNTTYRNVWTPANTPRSHAHFDSRLPSPRSILAGICRDETRKFGLTTSKHTSPALSPKSRLLDADEEYDGDSSGESSSESSRKLTKLRPTSTRILPSDEKAAYLLMSLRLEKTGVVQEVEGRKRRASA